MIPNRLTHRWRLTPDRGRRVTFRRFAERRLARPKPEVELRVGNSPVPVSSGGTRSPMALHRCNFWFRGGRRPVLRPAFCDGLSGHRRTCRSGLSGRCGRCVAAVSQVAAHALLCSLSPGPDATRVLRLLAVFDSRFAVPSGALPRAVVEFDRFVAIVFFVSIVAVTTIGTIGTSHTIGTNGIRRKSCTLGITRIT